MKMKLLIKKCRRHLFPSGEGFTLVEVMIGIGLLGIMTLSLMLGLRLRSRRFVLRKW
jgi:prepilin-type N-terminal cleavage/methylation domain-containing protein